MSGDIAQVEGLAQCRAMPCEVGLGVVEWAMPELNGSSWPTKLLDHHSTRDAVTGTFNTESGTGKLATL